MAVHAPANADESHSDPSFDLGSDLASEWENSLSAVGQVEDGHADERVPDADLPTAVDADAASNPEIAETVEEIRFYLEHFMIEQAHAAMEKLEALTGDTGILDPLRAAFASANQPPGDPEPEIA